MPEKEKEERRAGSARSLSAQGDDGGAAAAESGAGKGEPCNIGPPGKKGMNRALQLAGPFAVNDPHFQYAARAAFVQIHRHQASYLPWIGGVQVHDAVNGQRRGRRFWVRRGQ